MVEIGDIEDSIAGEKLAAVGRKIGRVFVITGPGAHPVQRVYIWGDPARCYVDEAIRKTLIPVMSSGRRTGAGRPKRGTRTRPR